VKRRFGSSDAKRRAAADRGEIRPQVSLQDDLMARHAPHPLIGRAQRFHARIRSGLFKSDEWLSDAIAFARGRE
jgi:hypothetical protein